MHDKICPEAARNITDIEEIRDILGMVKRLSGKRGNDPKQEIRS